MTVNTLCNQTHLIVHVGRGLPCIIGEPHFVTCGAELRTGSAYHDVLGQTEQRKGHERDQDNKGAFLLLFFTFVPFGQGWLLGATFAN